MKGILEELISIPGPCGYEHGVIRYLRDRLAPHTDACTVDGIGNLIVSKHGAYPGPTLVMSAHTDEVGFIIKEIEPNGLLRFEKLGGHDDRILLSEQVVISTAKGPIPAVIGTISAHMMKADNASLVRKHTELYIDAGAADAKEAAEMGIAVGDFVTWATPWTPAGPHRVYGHAFDDRAGCAVLVRVLEELDFSRVHGTLVFVFSTQEEVGLRGARVAAHQVQGDVAIAVDTTAVSDTFEAMMDHTLALGAGAGIKVMDFSMVASPAVWRRLRTVAETQAIPHQLEIFTGIGTDAGELHQSKGGIPTSVISVPTRYAHSSVEMMDLCDFEACVSLLKAFALDMRSKEEFAFLAES